MYKLKRRLNKIIAGHTGKTVEEVERDADRDHWLGAEEAVEYGLVDKVLENKKELPEAVSEAVEADKQDNDK